MVANFNTFKRLVVQDSLVTKAADNGMVQAYGAVGYCYQNGLGVETDLDKMLEYRDTYGAKKL